MPIVAVLVSLVIMLIPPLQQLLTEKSYFIYRAFYVPFQTVGLALTPCILIVLGANIGAIMER